LTKSKEWDECCDESDSGYSWLNVIISILDI